MNFSFWSKFNLSPDWEGELMAEVRVRGVVVVNTNKGWWRSQKNGIQRAAPLKRNSIICPPKQRSKEEGRGTAVVFTSASMRKDGEKPRRGPDFCLPSLSIWSFGHTCYGQQQSFQNICLVSLGLLYTIQFYSLCHHTRTSSLAPISLMRSGRCSFCRAAGPIPERALSCTRSVVPFACFRGKCSTLTNKRALST